MKKISLTLITLTLLSFNTIAETQPFAFKERPVIIENDNLTPDEIKALSQIPSQNAKDIEERQKLIIAEIVEKTLMNVLFDGKENILSPDSFVDFEGSQIVGSVEDMVLVRLTNDHTELVSLEFYKNEMSQFNKQRNEVIETIKQDITKQEETRNNLRTQ